MVEKIKDRLDDCQEPLPAGGWERLERELGQTGQSAFSPSRSKRIVVMRRWSVAAAAALLVAVSGISFWLLHSPAGEEMRRAEVPVVRPYDRMPEPAVEDEALARVDEPVLQEMKPAVVTSRKRYVRNRKYQKIMFLLFRTTNHRTCLSPTSLKKRNMRRKLLSVRKLRMKNRFLPCRKRRRQVWMNRWCCPNRPGRKIRDGLSACQSGTTVRHWEMTVNGIW